MTHLLRHHPELREEDGAVDWSRLLHHFNRSRFPEDVSQWGWQDWIDRLKRGSDKTRFEHCLNSLGKIQYLRAFRGHSSEVRVDPTQQSNVKVPNGWTNYIYHVGTSWDYRYIADAGLLAGGTGNSQGRHTCFFTAVDP